MKLVVVVALNREGCNVWKASGSTRAVVVIVDEFSLRNMGRGGRDAWKVSEKNLRMMRFWIAQRPITDRRQDEC